MPPYNQRRNTSPEISLTPDQRQVEGQSLQARPEYTAPADPNAGAAFGMLADALNLGTKVAGVYQQTARKEKTDQFKLDIAKAKTDYREGTVGPSVLDGLAVRAGEDVEMLTMLEAAKSDLDYYSSRGVSGTRVGAQLFDELNDAATKAEFLAQLPEGVSLSDALPAAMEEAAETIIPGYNDLDPRDRVAAMRYGMRFFRDELKQEKVEMDAMEKEVAVRTATANFNAAIVDGDADEIVETAFDRFGFSETAPSSVFDALVANGSSLDEINKVREKMLESNNYAINRVDPAYDQAVFAAVETMATDDVGQLDAIMGVGAVMRQWTGETDQLTSDNIESVVVDTYLDAKGLPDDPLTRAAVEKALKPQITAAQQNLVAREKHADNVAAITDGTATVDQIDQTYQVSGEPLRELIASAKDMSYDDVVANAATISAQAAEWAKFQNQSGNDMPLPSELAASMQGLANSGSTAERMFAVALYQGLGGARSPQVVGNLDARSQVNMETAAILLGKYGTPSNYAAEMAKQGIPVSGEDSATSVLFSMDEITNQGPTEVEAFANALNELATEQFGSAGYLYGWALGFGADPVGAELLAPVSKGVIDGFSEIARQHSSNPEVQAATMLALFQSAGYRGIAQAEGQDPQMVLDPMRRLPPNIASMNDFATQSIMDMDDKFLSSEIGTTSGLRDALRSGRLEAHMDPSSLSPTTDTVIFYLTATDGSLGSQEIEVNWADVPVYGKKRAEAEYADQNSAVYVAPTYKRNTDDESKAKLDAFVADPTMNDNNPLESGILFDNRGSNFNK